jgi:hypothetical protein
MLQSLHFLKDESEHWLTVYSVVPVAVDNLHGAGREVAMAVVKGFHGRSQYSCKAPCLFQRRYSIGLVADSLNGVQTIATVA